MAQLRFRITGPTQAFQNLSEALSGIEGVQWAEEVADLVPRMDDEDSSSLGLAENAQGEVIEMLVETDDDDRIINLVRRQAEQQVRSAGGFLELIPPE